MSEQLNLEPEAGLKVTADFIGEVSSGATAPNITVSVMDSLGCAFDGSIHRVDETGAPILGSKKQFLLKKEAKKSAVKWAKDKFSELWNGEKPEKTEAQEIPEAPLSDHELSEIQAENKEKEISEGRESAQKRADLTASSENSADLFFIGGSMALGIEFLNQRDRFHPQVSSAIYEYERKTGKSIDLPPGLALACGLGRIGWEIIQREPACKQRFDSGAQVVRDNAVKFVTRKFPKFHKAEPES
jgi:hypothetical protein